MYVCIYACMYICMHVCMYLCTHISKYVRYLTVPWVPEIVGASRGGAIGNGPTDLARIGLPRLDLGGRQAPNGLRASFWGRLGARLGAVLAPFLGSISALLAHWSAQVGPKAPFKPIFFRKISHWILQSGESRDRTFYLGNS